MPATTGSYNSKQASRSMLILPFVHNSSVTWYQQGTCTSEHYTPIDSSVTKDASFLSTAAKCVQPTSFGLIHTCTSLSHSLGASFTSIHVCMSIRQQTSRCRWNNHAPCYKGCILSPSINEPQLMICHQYISLLIAISLQAQNVYISECMQFTHNYSYHKYWKKLFNLKTVQIGLLQKHLNSNP